MARKLFGTDGVRGRANTAPMTAEMALKLGAAAGQYFGGPERKHRVVIGKDTRRSGYMLENALTAGLTSVGMNVFLLGPVPTPAVSMLTRSMRADLGVMISASHNSHEDNGIKFFGPDGYKLSDNVELELERLLEKEPVLVPPAEIGRARYKTAPEVLFELGAEIIPIGVTPDGFNINKDVGSTSLSTACEMVKNTRADMGIALDGDADRVMIIDEKGRVADGDQIMGLIATTWAKEDRLNGGTLVATVMSNLGLERHLESQNLKLMRTSVGDRYVVEAMRKGNFNLGGEQSGHIVFRDYVTTGDGLRTAFNPQIWDRAFGAGDGRMRR